MEENTKQMEAIFFHLIVRQEPLTLMPLYGNEVLKVSMLFHHLQ